MDTNPETKIDKPDSKGVMREYDRKYSYKDNFFDVLYALSGMIKANDNNEYVLTINPKVYKMLKDQGLVD